MALIDAANDKQKEVRQMIVTSLHEIGKKQPEMVLSTIKAYLVKHQKVSVITFQCDQIFDIVNLWVIKI